MIGLKKSPAVGRDFLQSVAGVLSTEPAEISLAVKIFNETSNYSSLTMDSVLLTPGSVFPTQYSILIQRPEINANQLTYSWFLHGDAVDHIHCTHRHFIVGDYDEL